jgi:dTDP-4-amino-4,6-dideoxygalactose transaminase
MIPFNTPCVTGNEIQYVLEAIQSAKISGNGAFAKKCQRWFDEQLKCNKSLLTPSCTQALELAALLIDIQPGDEVIMPSFTFVSTANAFVLRGAKIVCVDIRPDTMNMDEALIEAAITPKTKAIVPVHYAGVPCEMDTIMDLSKRYNLFIIEDAAQGMMSAYKDKPLGSIGHMAAYSFHETKNYTSGGEGGLLIINDSSFAERAEIIREKGTNRSLFFRGMVDKYSWVDLGSSYLPSELQAAYLWGQLEKANDINQHRLMHWQAYHNGLQQLAEKGLIEIPLIPQHCTHNGHMFYMKAKNLQERQELIQHLKAQEIMAVFHYVPLHNADAGKKFARFSGIDQFTTRESERLLRLPLFYGLKNEQIEETIQAIVTFYE